MAMSVLLLLLASSTATASLIGLNAGSNDIDSSIVSMPQAGLASRELLQIMGATNNAIVALNKICLDSIGNGKECRALNQYIQSCRVLYGPAVLRCNKFGASACINSNYYIKDKTSKNACQKVKVIKKIISHPKKLLRPPPSSHQTTLPPQGKKGNKKNAPPPKKPLVRPPPPSHKSPPPPKGPGEVLYDWHVTLRHASPDCFGKQTIVVNGEFQPTITVRQGQVTLHNDLPVDYPTNAAGLSLHWHGLSLDSPDNSSVWNDGVPYVHHCPIVIGSKMTYRFVVTQTPGTYLWHDHTSANRADGLSGPLIILPPVGVTPPGTPLYDAEETIFIQDWFHEQGPVLAFGLNRPFDVAKQTNETGAWKWVGLPQSILLNGKAFYGDCTMVPGSKSNAPCNVTTATVPANGTISNYNGSSTNSGCSHYSTTVTRGKTYLYRLINAGTLTYQTVCFEGHNVTIVAADGIPTDPLVVQCVDVNAGQRYDVLLLADQPARTYYFTTSTQYRTGAPDGFGFLHYADSDLSALPSTPTPQPNSTAPWTVALINQVHVSHALLPDLTPPPATVTFGINISQPLLQPTGQLRWALNNIAHSDDPPCDTLLKEIQTDKNFYAKHAASAGLNGTLNVNSTGVVGIQNGGPEALKQKNIYLDNAFPITPVAGLHVIRITTGDVVDVIIQNDMANAYNGDYRVNNTRVAEEQHPFHLHGYHFWVLGTGMGVYSKAAFGASLNTVNPVSRDTVSVIKGGWAVVRFQADNPGIWIMHCHIMWHHMMGQAVLFSESPELVGSPKIALPLCPVTCPAAFAPWSPATVQQLYGNSSYGLGRR